MLENLGPIACNGLWQSLGLLESEGSKFEENLS